MMRQRFGRCWKVTTGAARRPPRRVAADWWILRSPRARSRRVLRVVSATRALAIARGVRSRPRRRRRSRSRTRGARRASLRRGFAKRVGEGIGIDDCRKRGGSRPASPLPPGSPRPARRSPFAFARRAPVPELLRGRHLRARGGVAPNHGRKHRRGRARARRAETRSPRSTSARSPPPRRDDARFRRRPTPVPSARGFAGAADSASGANAERATSTGRGARRSRGGECAEARACRARRCRAGCKGALPCHPDRRRDGPAPSSAFCWAIVFNDDDESLSSSALKGGLHFLSLAAASASFASLPPSPLPSLATTSPSTRDGRASLTIISGTCSG